MSEFRKKPVVIEAVRVIDLFAGVPWAEWITEAVVRGEFSVHSEGQYVVIDTLEGQMHGETDDWIIRSVQGELYPCKPDIFAATYEPVTP